MIGYNSNDQDEALQDMSGQDEDDDFAGLEVL